MIDPPREIAVPPTKRRWLQFSLRTFLLAVAVAAVVLAILYRRSPIHASNVSSLRLVGSLDKDVYTLDWSPDGNPLVTGGRNAPITIWDARVLSVLRERFPPRIG